MNGKDLEKRSEPRINKLTAQGIKTSQDFKAFMAALMLDVADGLVTASQTNAACNAGAKLLKAAELELKHGTATKADGKGRTKTLQLIGGPK